MQNLIVKDNALITASHKLGEVEQRLILLAIVKIRAAGDTVEAVKGRELIIHASDYMDAYGVSRQPAYRSLKKAVMGLYRAEWGYRSINEKGNTVVNYERFTQSARYIEAEATVKFKFSDAIIPLLVELERNFTSYNLDEVRQLGQYGLRLYEMLKQFKKTGRLYMSVADIRYSFGLTENEYKRLDNLKRRIIDKAVKDINDNTQLTVSYEQHKQGRSIVGFDFTFKTQTQTPAQTPTPSEKLEPQTDEERSLIVKKNAYADSINATDSHRQNMINKALREYRAAQNAKQVRKQQAKQQAQEKAQADAQMLEQADKIYNRLVDDSRLAAQFVADNSQRINNWGVENQLMKIGDYIGIVKAWRRKFESINEFKALNLDAIK